MPLIDNPQPTLVNTKRVQVARAVATASGNVAYTGVGFKPRAIIFLSTGQHAATGIAFSIGWSDLPLGAVCIWGNTANDLILRYSSSYSIIIAQDNGLAAGQFAGTLSYDTDGFTLAWVKAGAGAIQPILIDALCIQ